MLLKRVELEINYKFKIYGYNIYILVCREKEKGRLIEKPQRVGRANEYAKKLT